MPEQQQPQTELPLSPPPAAPAKQRYEIPVFVKDKEEAAPDTQAPEVKTDQKPESQEAPAEPQAKAEEVTPDPAVKRETRRFERRIDKAYKARAEAEARAKQLEGELATLKKPATPAGEPRLEQFDYDPEKYAAAKAEYAKSQVAKEIEAKRQEESNKAEIERLNSTWEEKADLGAEKFPDWAEKVGTIQPVNPLSAAIMESEPDVAYHLATNPKELERIAALPVLSQIREIGKLELKLLSKPAEAKAPSKAPAPISPLTGTVPKTTDAPSEEDSDKEWIRKRQKQVYGKR